MALGDFSIFSWKSKDAQQKEQEAYAAWAFPYGQKQRDSLEALLKELYPKETIPLIMIPFLTCKELYEKALKNSDSQDMVIEEMVNAQKKYRQLIGKNDMTMYLAVVIADADADERCIYPSADEIRARAQELEKLKRGR